MTTTRLPSPSAISLLAFRPFLLALALSALQPFSPSALCGASAPPAPPPQIGAQIWIEPGQTRDQIDRWFALLEQHDMPVARLFIQWNFIERAPGQWDWTLYDWAFDAAAKHNVAIVATLSPNQGPAHVSPGYAGQLQRNALPTTQTELTAADAYIRRAVDRYRAHPALDTWMLMNEPSCGPFNGELGMSHYRPWLAALYKNDIAALNTAWAAAYRSFDEITYNPAWTSPKGFVAAQPFYDWQRFTAGFLTWHMRHIADTIRKTDTAHPLHVNPHAIFNSIDSYELPAWRKFLDSLGASIHPTWHFRMLRRDQFPEGVSATCAIIRGASAPKPFWVTELQGGMNTYSGGIPVNPAPADINQWVWTSVGAGAKRIIFWLLNHRAQGGEAGEWSMLDATGAPSERLTASAAIARTLKDRADIFSAAFPLHTRVTLLVSPESTRVLQHKNVSNKNAAADPMTHAYSWLAYYETLASLGITPEVKYIDDIDARGYGQPYSGGIFVLANAVALTREQVAILKWWVSAGNTLIIDGATGTFDENETATTHTDFYLRELTGGVVRDIRYAGDRFTFPLRGAPAPLSASTWETEIKNPPGASRATPLAEKSGRILALENTIGSGKVIWIPQTISLEAWRKSADPAATAPFAAWLAVETAAIVRDQPVAFAQRAPGCLMQTLRSGDDYVTVIVNQNQSHGATIALVAKNLTTLPAVIFGPPDALTAPTALRLAPKETIVLLWKKRT